MIRRKSIADHEEVKRVLNIARRHLKYINKSRTKRIEVPGLKPDHAIVASIFSAAAVEIGINIYLGLPLLNLNDSGARQFCASLLKRALRSSIKNKVDIINDLNKTIKKDKALLRDIRELFNYRNSILHSAPEYIESSNVTVDWGRRAIQESAGKSLSLISRGTSSSEVREAYKHYDVALKFLNKLPLSIEHNKGPNNDHI